MKTNISFPIFSFLMVLGLSHYAYAQDHTAPSTESKESGSDHHDTGEIHWDYEGEGRPENWGKIKGDYKTCRMGQFQSPVDLHPTLQADLAPLLMDYRESALTVVNNGHTVQFNFQEGSRMIVGEQVFNLVQMHFHTPSEHTVDGKSYPMELHLVHKTKEGGLGVLGVFIEEGSENLAASQIWKYMPKEKSDDMPVPDIALNANALLPANLTYYRLSGSLTTPPCTEGVNWHVLAQPVSFSKEQIEAFQSIFSHNARPVQPLGHRMLILDR